MTSRCSPPPPAMRLIEPAAWADRYFAPGSQPPETTLRRWMQTGAVPAVKIGGKWYINEATWLAGGDDLVARVLQTG